MSGPAEVPGSPETVVPVDPAAAEQLGPALAALVARPPSPRWDRDRFDALQQKADRLQARFQADTDRYAELMRQIAAAQAARRMRRLKDLLGQVKGLSGGQDLQLVQRELRTAHEELQRLCDERMVDSLRAARDPGGATLWNDLQACQAAADAGDEGAQSRREDLTRRWEELQDELRTRAYDDSRGSSGSSDDRS